MASGFPTTIDDFVDPLSTSALNSPSHSGLHSDLNDAIFRVETAVKYPRNLLYNGAMQVAQRGTSTPSITTSGYYTADRYKLYLSSLGTWTQSVENDAPTGSGFGKSLKMLCTTADASPGASDALIVQQLLEGQDLQSVAKGTTSAQQLTLSFWVKSNVTGTYIMELFDNDNARCCSKSYTVSASATWEFKTLVFPADTTGAFDNDNAASFTLQMWLGAGTTFTSGTLATTWASQTNANRAVGQTNLASATNNYWQITGVQLNVGPVASPFEFKSYGRELRECQRYYEKSYNSGIAAGTVTSVGSQIHFGSTASDGSLYVTIPFKESKRSSGYTNSYYTTGGTLGSWTQVRNGSTSAVTVYVAYRSEGSISVYVFTGANWVVGYVQGHWIIDDEL